MPKKRFSDGDRKNGFTILNLHPKKYIFKKIPFFNANLLQSKFQFTLEFIKIPNI